MRPRSAVLMARALCASALLASSVFVAAPASAAADCAGLPKHGGLPVVDAANVVDAEDEAWLSADLMLHRISGHEAIVAATVPDLGGDDVSSYATRLFDCWRIGDAQSDNGVLILVAIRERRVRIELGAGLDGRLSDRQLEAAIDTMGAPLRAGEVGAALRSAANVVVRDLGGQLPDTKANGGSVPSMISPDDGAGDVDVPDTPDVLPFADGRLPDGVGPFDEPGNPGAGIAALFPVFFVGMVIVIAARAVTRAASVVRGGSYGESWRGGFPGYGGAWGPPTMLHHGAWHDTDGTSAGSAGASWGGRGGSTEPSGSSGSASGSASGSSESSGSGGSFGGGSSGGGGASGSW